MQDAAPVRDLTVSHQEWQHLGRFGPFFAVSVMDDDPRSASAAAEWLPLKALVEDPDLLRGRIDAVRHALARPSETTPGGVPAQVAVSVTQFGLVARLVSVGLAAAVDGLDPPRSPDLAFQDRLGGPYPVAIMRRPVAQAFDVARWPHSLMQLVRPITQLCINGHSLSAQVGWGNVASALASATKMITAVDPVAGVRARVSAGLAFTAPELQGTGSADEAGVFRRRSCCLIYRSAADRVFCGDCVLAG